MMNIMGIIIVIGIVSAFSVCWGIIIERDRMRRFPTKDEKLAKVIQLTPPMSRAQRKRLERHRLDLRKALKR